MSVIQNIRDKYARVSVIMIALALLGFIAMDAFTGRSNLFGGGQSKTIGSVNGETISIDDFRKSVAAEEQSMQSQGMPSGAAATQRAVENTWNREVSKALLMSELEKLGITVSEKEFNNSILYGRNPPEDLKKSFVNPQTGEFDAQALSIRLREVRKSGSPEEKANINAYLSNLRLSRLEEKYISLLNKSVNYPKWLIDRQKADDNQQATISLVRKTYGEIADTAVAITDQEISAYVAKHKTDPQFKQTESRNISYVSFSALPNPADSAALKQDLQNLKQGFVEATDAQAYVAKNATEFIPSIYAGKSLMQMAAKDTLQTLPVGGVFGPYVDGGNMVLAKMLDTKVLPDSVRCRHILIGTMDRQGQQIMPDSIAKLKIDSVENAIKAGADFDTLETRYSTDQAAHADKGVMTFSSTNIQDENFAKEFGDFILFGNPGDKKVVKTQFGYHYIEILAFIKPETHYKIAYLMKPIVTSPETDQKAKNDASDFAGSARDEKSFNEAYEKKWKPLGYTKGIGADITPTASQIMGLGFDRDFVKSIYDAKKGQVLAPAFVNESYVVALVTDVSDEGTMSPAKARMAVEPLLRNQKKAEIIKKEFGKITTLEEVAARLKKNVETIDSVKLFGNNPGLGYEPRVLGATFNPANRGKVVGEPIAGADGVYALKVDNVTAIAETGASTDERRKMMIDQASQRLPYPLEAVKQAAKIKDNRSKFY